jgi:hypothetical protein
MPRTLDSPHPSLPVTTLRTREDATRLPPLEGEGTCACGCPEGVHRIDGPCCGCDGCLSYVPVDDAAPGEP